LIIDSKGEKKEGLMTPIETVKEPLSTYHIDHVNPLTETKEEYSQVFSWIF